MKHRQTIVGILFVLVLCRYGAVWAADEPPPEPGTVLPESAVSPGAAGEPSAPGPSEAGAKTLPAEVNSPDQARPAYWHVLLLLIPGILGLAAAYIKECYASRAPGRGARGDATTSDADGDRSSGAKHESRFAIAMVSGLIWGVTLTLLIWQGEVGAEGGLSLRLLHPALEVELYVPILGFVGSLLYILDLSRRGYEDIPKGTEFGLRLIMGPYVAIVMVVLFGENLGIIDLTEPTARAALAFLSGLLVVSALQGLIERGQEQLGKWRRQASGYTPSELATRFNLNSDEDLALRSAGLQYPMQLRDYGTHELQTLVRQTGFDPRLAAGMKRTVEKEQLEAALGDLVWDRLKKIGVRTLEGFGLLDPSTLEQLAQDDPKVDAEALKEVQKRVKALYASPAS